MTSRSKSCRALKPRTLFAGTLLLVVLSFVPLVASAHYHGPQQPGSSSTCAVCIATSHAPAAIAAALPQLAPSQQELPIEVAVRIVSIPGYQAFKARRAPPSFLIATT